jgi:hypothetical protein
LVRPRTPRSVATALLRRPRTSDWQDIVPTKTVIARSPFPWCEVYETGTWWEQVPTSSEAPSGLRGGGMGTGGPQPNPDPATRVAAALIQTRTDFLLAMLMQRAVQWACEQHRRDLCSA